MTAQLGNGHLLIRVAHNREFKRPTERGGEEFRVTNYIPPFCAYDYKVSLFLAIISCHVVDGGEKIQSWYDTSTVRVSSELRTSELPSVEGEEREN